MARPSQEKGFTLLEVIAVFMVIALAAALALSYHARSQRDAAVNDLAGAVTAMAGQAQTIAHKLGSASWVDTPRTIYESGLVGYPIRYDSQEQMLYDQWDSMVYMLSMNAGPTRFLVALGFPGSSSNRNYEPETCVALASKLAPTAHTVTVGAITAVNASGPTGGLVYKAADSTLNQANLLAGCSQATPRIVLQYP